jgi:LysR family transcriptional regulator, glycine cleavage system transcriptional activator
MSRHSPRLPPLNALRAFEVSARHLNFGIAAEELGVTQGAVAQHVRGLEADLAIKLFDRLPRTLALTDHGRRYAGQLRRAFELIAEATTTLRPEPLRLTISVTPTFAAKWLIPRLPAFSADHPDIELRIFASESLSNFQNDGVDVAVRQGRLPFGPGLIADLLFEQEIVAVGSPALVGDKACALSPDEIGHFTLLDDSHDMWPEFLDRALGRSAVPAAKHVRFNQTSLAIDTAIAGQGLAVASSFLVEQDIAEKRLVQAFEGTMRGRLDTYVVTLRKPRQPKSTEIVKRWLLGHRTKRACWRTAQSG